MESYIEADFSAIDNSLIGKIDMSKVEINENLLFNSSEKLILRYSLLQISVETDKETDKKYNNNRL